MLCPAEPVEGLNEEMTGGPAGATATVVEVEVVVEVVFEDGVALGRVASLAPARRGFVDGGRDGKVVVRTERAAVDDEGAGPATKETSNATAAAATSAATTATERISQR